LYFRCVWYILFLYFVLPLSLVHSFHRHHLNFAVAILTRKPGRQWISTLQHAYPIPLCRHKFTHKHTLTVLVDCNVSCRGCRPSGWMSLLTWMSLCCCDQLLS
jgi:hypothetical protein